MALRVPFHRAALARLLLGPVFVGSAIAACAPETAVPRTFAEGCTMDISTVRCQDCIQFGYEARLGSVDGPGFLEPRGGIEAVVRDLDGNYWVGQGEKINVYAPGGNYLAAVGREGEGPLEFRYARPLHADARGRVHIFDISNMRISVVDLLEQGQVALVDAQGLPAAINSIVPIDDGERYVIQAWLRTPGERASPLHLVEAGEIVRSLGSVDSADQPESAYEASFQLHLAASTEGELFLARARDYLIESWALDGSFRGRVEGIPALDDGRRGETGAAYAPENPPWNSLVDIHVDTGGMLWVLLWFRRADWRDRSEEIVYPDGEVAVAPRDMVPSNWYRSRIDVIDPASCAVVASAWHDEVFVGFVADGYMAAGVTAEMGSPHIDIYRMALEGNDVK